MAARKHIDFVLRGDFIPLDALLKACGLASSGGVAKQLITQGVVVDGVVEHRRGRKIRAGQAVCVDDFKIAVFAAPEWQS